MIPNCRGCIKEMYEAYELQEKGFDVVLENMGVQAHCFFIAFDSKTGEWVAR